MKQISTSNLGRTTLVAGFCLTLTWLASTVSDAETLEGVIDSKAMQEFTLSGTKINRKGKDPNRDSWLRGIDPGSTFASIWSSSDSPQLLLNWAGAKLPYVHFKRPHGSRSRDFVSAEVELSTSQRETARLSIIVPHPSIAPLVEGNVLEEFRRLRPPLLSVLSEKPIPLEGVEGKLYEHSKGGGSLVIPIARNGLINLTIRDFKQSQFLIDIAKGLDLERLNRKLDS